jgi:hypothetical protein
MWPTTSDDMKVLIYPFLSNLNRQVPPKRLCEKPNAVLKSQRAAHKTLEVYLRRGTEFHGVVAADHQIMGLKDAFRHHLTNFLEISLRCNA